MNNGDLFDDVLPPAQRHSPTSMAAAELILPNAGTLRRQVYECLLAAGAYGRTDEEIQDRERIGASTERPRRIELVEAALVKASGYTRPTKSGRQAVVWVAVAP